MDETITDYLMRYISEEYANELTEAVTRGLDYFKIDFRGLNEEAKKVLRRDFYTYVRRGTTATTLHDVITDLFKSKQAELGIVRELRPVQLWFTNVTPHKKIREITSEDIGSLMMVNGVVISITPPHSMIVKAKFRCNICGEVMYEYQDSPTIIKPQKCVTPKCKSKSFTLIETESEWEDYQEIILQENPEEVEAGVVPRTMRCRAIGRQLIDQCKPGDLVNITCSLIPVSQRSGKKVFSWCLDINYIEVLNKDSYTVELTDDDIYGLLDIARHENLEKVLLESIFPSIYGRTYEKLGLVLAMFGGVEKKRVDKTDRGTINVLLIGDPSTAKTRMLLAIKNVAPKAIYTSGKGASGVGLTAAAIHDQMGWRLEAGAMVLADRGICCIDEIDKMDPSDREKVHEAMSTGTVSIDKANIHTTLNARTTVLAAANPVGGRYDRKLYLVDNTNLPPTILSRFDLIFIIEDIPNEEEDRAIAKKIFELDEKEDMPILDPETIKKYVLYAKTLKPKITREAINKIMDYYIPIRKKSIDILNKPVGIAVRQLEGLKRLTQAAARMRLKEVADVEDAELAIEIMEKSLETAGYDPVTGDRDINIVEGVMPKSKNDRRKIIDSIILSHVEGIDVEEIVSIMETTYGVETAETLRLLDEMLNAGMLYNPDGRGRYWIHYRNLKYVNGDTDSVWGS